MSEVRAKQFDIGKTFNGLLTSDGVAVDLTDATQILFIMTHEESGAVVSGEAVVEGDATDGAVKYVSASGDLDVAGKYRQEWEVTFTPNRKGTFPEGRYNYVIVLADGNGE